ncbi:MAG: PepSY domain-containing protein [Acidobacteriota bacterium]
MKIETAIADIEAKPVDQVGKNGTLTDNFNEPDVPASQPIPRLYRVIWRWHFYAGLIVLPVLLTAAITGGLYVFVKEIEPWIYPYRTVMPQMQVVTYQQQLEAAKAVVPQGFEAHGLTLSDDAQRATIITFHQQPERYLYVFVNQHTGEVQGQTEYGDSFFDIVLKIHRTLFAGSTGRYIVELATSWGIILVVTGIYLWWPRGRRKIIGVWLPRLRGKSYAVWRDWHTVPGFYFSILAFLVMFTGLFFTQFFGRVYDIAAYLTNAYPQSYLRPPKSSVREGAKPLSLDKVIAIARREQSEPQLFVDLPHTAEDSFSVYCGTTDKLSTYSNLHIEQYSGTILDHVTFKDLSPMAKTRLLAYPIHVGSIYGMPTKILAFLVCLLIVAMSVTGVVMWWKRKPRGKTGFPQKTEAFKPAKWLLVTIALLGMLMPAAGISILVILLGDWLLQKKRAAQAES